MDSRRKVRHTTYSRKGGASIASTGSAGVANASAVIASTGGSKAYSNRSFVLGSGANSKSYGSRSGIINSLNSETDKKAIHN